MISSLNLSWRGFVPRTTVLWIVEVVALMPLLRLIPGLRLACSISAIVFGIAILLPNALLWPILPKLNLRFPVFTFGAGVIALNIILVWLVSLVDAGVSAEGWTLISASVCIGIVTTFASMILTIDDEATYRRFLRSQRLTLEAEKPARRRGTIFLEIDGLSEVVLRQALKKGYMPTLSRWLARRSHKLIAWETDLSSQTSASQAGILHGNNNDIPAYRWVEKENDNKIRVSASLSDAPVIEERISNGAGLLCNDGASRSNLFSGDAKDTVFTFSKLKEMRNLYSAIRYFFYSDPYNFPRTVALACWDILQELHSGIRRSFRRVTPRLRIEFTHLFVRATANVVLREVTTYTLVRDIMQGQRDVVYATYMGYDEVAHHTGVFSEEALNVLKQLDRQFARLEQANKISARDYNLVVLSDHGQSGGATFKQRYGLSLRELVRKRVPEHLTLHSEFPTHHDHFAEVITDPIERISLLFKKHSTDPETAHVIVLGSGNLGLVYFTQWKQRLSYEMLDREFPGLISSLVVHPGISFVMTNSEVHGPMVIGAKGTYFLKLAKVERENPLSNFGKHAVSHLLRYNGFRYAPDILVNSMYDPASNEVAAFEEKIGCHGGLGGDQSKPFLMYPASWRLEGEGIVGAEKLHVVLRKRIGLDFEAIPLKLRKNA